MKAYLSAQIDDLKTSDRILVETGAILKLLKTCDFQQETHNAEIDNAVIQYAMAGLYTLIGQAEELLSNSMYTIEECAVEKYGESIKQSVNDLMDTFESEVQSRVTNCETRRTGSNKECGHELREMNGYIVGAPADDEKEK